jgi:hypothetical protein
MARKFVWAALGGCLLLVGWWGLTRLGGPRSDPDNRASAAEPNKGPRHDYGFTDAFEAEVKKIGQITPEQFAQQFPGNAKYLAKMSWDPTTGKYWDRFQVDPKGDPKFTDPKKTHLFDFRPNAKELALFKEKGFVVSERMGSHSFTDLYYRLYARDLPVFVTSDSMLHAWHRYFDRMLEGMELEYFLPEFQAMLAAMSAEIPAAQKAYAKGALGEALTDADFFLAVAQKLLGQGNHSKLGQEKRVDEAEQACLREKMELDFPLFGRGRDIDFSQFKPRGRYDQNEGTQKYFRSVMWLGRMDFRIAGGDNADQDMRELAGAIVMNDLLVRAKMKERWQQLDRVLLHLIGKADSLNFSQLGTVLVDAKIQGAEQVTPDALAALRTRIQESKIGEQHIRGEWFNVDPNDPRKFVLPRSFCFMGQRFILDSWVLSKIVYDDIIWDKEKIQRRIPSCVDMGFAVLGNDHLVPTLTRRMNDAGGKKFRDGLPYQHNLAAARNIVDRLPESTWKESLYTDWLGCLRELSKPTTDAKYPEAVRTSEWAMKTTMTQTASWTQLRHDTILYAKPSYTSGVLCEYPAGFVEPVPHFWKCYEQMILRTKDVLAKTSAFHVKKKDEPGRLARHLMHIENFVNAAKMLSAISEKQVAQQELSKAETAFLKEVIMLRGECGSPSPNGWYPNLFTHRSDIPDMDDAHKWVALVTDVHTDPPARPVGDPGCVLHQAVGNVDLLLIAIDNGKDRMVYAGPVFSHYEFETPNAVRRVNGEWHEELRSGKHPPRPEWTRGFVVPGVNPDAKDYGKTVNPNGGKGG